MIAESVHVFLHGPFGQRTIRDLEKLGVMQGQRNAQGQLLGLIQQLIGEQGIPLSAIDRIDHQGDAPRFVPEDLAVEVTIGPG